MILLIDNYDSFTWNLVQRLGEIDRSLEPDRDLMVVRHDEITPEQAEQLDDGRGPTHLIISPGPCTPKEAGVSSDMIAHHFFPGRSIYFRDPYSNSVELITSDIWKGPSS